MSAPAQTSLSVQQFLTKDGMSPIPHPPYLPDRPPATFCLCPWVKKVLKKKHFANGEELKQKMAEALKGIKINKFKYCFEQWKNVLIGELHQMDSIWEVIKV